MRHLLFHNKIMGIIAAKNCVYDDQQSSSTCDADDFNVRQHIRRQKADYEEANTFSWWETFKISMLGLVVMLPALLIVAGGFVAIIAFLLWLWT